MRASELREDMNDYEAEFLRGSKWGMSRWRSVQASEPGKPIMGLVGPRNGDSRMLGSFWKLTGFEKQLRRQSANGETPTPTKFHLHTTYVV